MTCGDSQGLENLRSGSSQHVVWEIIGKHLRTVEVRFRGEFHHVIATKSVKEIQLETISSRVHLYWVCGWWLCRSMVQFVPFSLSGDISFSSKEMLFNLLSLLEELKCKEKEGKIQSISCLRRPEPDLGKNGVRIEKWAVLIRARLSSSSRYICWYWEEQTAIHTVPYTLLSSSGKLWK